MTDQKLKRHQEISLRGYIDSRIEYHVTAAAEDAFNSYFYEQDDDSLRLFSNGNELVLTPEGVHYESNGGSFCQYMFGIDQPLADLVKPEVCNRLALFGTHYEEDGKLSFSQNVKGAQSYNRIFLEGHSVCNYFFFLGGLGEKDRVQQQRQILKVLGKQLKRSPHVGRQQESHLLEYIYPLLPPGSSFYLVRLINKAHRQYQELFRHLYFTYKSIPDDRYKGLCELARELKVEDYQQERIRIDAMYHHRDNRRIVDEYKEILLKCESRGQISEKENARLSRLKNLWIRNKIPAALFFTLDEMLNSERLVIKQEEAEYIRDTRLILRALVHRDAPGGRGMRRDDMIQLLFAKQQASNHRDRAFEQLLLETGREVDELIRDGANPQLIEDFSSVVTFFDRYDSTTNHINQLAFMVNYRLSESILRSLLGNRNAFERLRPGLFDLVFFKELRENAYLSQYGRLKIDCLQRGLDLVAAKQENLGDLLLKMRRLIYKERLTQSVLVHLKKRIRSAYSRYHTRNEQATLKEEVTQELMEKGLLQGALPASIFDEAIVYVQKEAMYLNHLLPRILKDGKQELREEFIKTSGLDRFYIEELEREYFSLNNLDMKRLTSFQRRSAA